MSAATQPQRADPSGARRSSGQPDLRVVGHRRHPGRYLLAMLLVVAVGLFAVVSISALAAQQAFRAREVTAEAEELGRRHDELVAEVARLESPERIRDAAVELGMVPAQSPTYLGDDPPATETGG